MVARNVGGFDRTLVRDERVRLVVPFCNIAVGVVVRVVVRNTVGEVIGFPVVRDAIAVGIRRFKRIGTILEFTPVTDAVTVPVGGNQVMRICFSTLWVECIAILMSE